MPPGISSEHLGPPDRYYWDNLWSLAGLLAAEQMLGSDGAGSAARNLRARLLASFEAEIPRGAAGPCPQPLGGGLIQA